MAGGKLSALSKAGAEPSDPQNLQVTPIGGLSPPRAPRTGHTALPWVPGKPTGSLSASVPSPLTHCRSVSLLDHQNPNEPSLLSPSWGEEGQPYKTQRLAAVRGAQRRRKGRNTVTVSMSLSRRAGSYRSGLSPVFVFEHMHILLCAG